MSAHNIEKIYQYFDLISSTYENLLDQGWLGYLILNPKMRKSIHHMEGDFQL